jgi:hypothetical protein
MKLNEQKDIRMGSSPSSSEMDESRPFSRVDSYESTDRLSESCSIGEELRSAKKVRFAPCTFKNPLVKQLTIPSCSPYVNLDGIVRQTESADKIPSSPE